MELIFYAEMVKISKIARKESRKSKMENFYTPDAYVQACKEGNLQGNITIKLMFIIHLKIWENELLNLIKRIFEDRRPYLPYDILKPFPEAIFNEYNRVADLTI